MTKEITYEAALSELENIVVSIERGDLPIDRLTAQLKRGQELLAFCKTQLMQVETEVNSLLNNPQNNE